MLNDFDGGDRGGPPPDGPMPESNEQIERALALNQARWYREFTINCRTQLPLHEAGCYKLLAKLRKELDPNIKGVADAKFVSDYLKWCRAPGATFPEVLIAQNKMIDDVERLMMDRFAVEV